MSLRIGVIGLKFGTYVLFSATKLKKDINIHSN